MKYADFSFLIFLYLISQAGASQNSWVDFYVVRRVLAGNNLLVYVLILSSCVYTSKIYKLPIITAECQFCSKIGSVE